MDYAQFVERVRGLTFHHSGAVIQKYPIGGSDYGLCRLEVHHSPRKGWRTVRTTTNKYGTWCKPKLSTYQTMPIGVVSGEIEGFEPIREYGWLNLDRINGVRFTRANLTTCKSMLMLPTAFRPDEGSPELAMFDECAEVFNEVAQIIIERMHFNPESRYQL